MASKDLYKVLGVARGASQDEIRTRYRKLARELHPDVNPGDEAAEARFKEITAAYGVLSDAEKRGLYDEFGDAALQAGFDKEKAEQYRRMGGMGGFDFSNFAQGFGGGFGGLDEILGGLFGGRFGGGGFRGGAAPRRGADLQAEVPISFALAIKGGKTPVHINNQQLEVNIPAGVKDGQTLRLAGLGGAGQPPGDLRLKLKVGKHPSYRRDGDDLHVDVPLRLSEAVEGAKVTIPTPTGEVTVTVPPNSQSGRSLRLRGLGVRGKGNLYARLQVVLPEPGEDDGARASLVELAQQADALYGDRDVRDGLRFE
jgi:curved DNA-binding protein